MTMTDHRSPAEIEREIEEERASLTGTLDELQNRFSIDRMTTEASDFIRGQGGELASVVSRAVRDNPMAVALTGAGIAWMILGSRRNGGSSQSSRGYGSSGYGDYDDDDVYGDYGASTVGRSAYPYRAGTEDRYAGGSYDEGGGRRGFTGTLRDEDPDWVRGYADVLGTPDDMGPSYDDDGDGNASSTSTADRMKEGFQRAGDRMREGAESTRHGAEGRIESARRRLNRLRERLAHGTEDLSEDSRRRIIAAREKAMEARHQLSREWDRRSRSAVNAYDRQPLAAGALAFAAGAAIAAALPRTQFEDEYMGEQSDHLLEEAERIFEEERAKLGRVAKATADEAKAVMGEKVEEMKHGVGAVQEEAREGAERVAAKAREEAEKQKLGQPGASTTT
jgi:gas vesicle protein